MGLRHRNWRTIQNLNLFYVENEDRILRNPIEIKIPITQVGTGLELPESARSHPLQPVPESRHETPVPKGEG